MWSDDDGPFDGRHYQLAETLCVPAPVSEPRPRILIGGSGERKTLRLVAQYADACNIMGDPDVIRHKVDVLHRHCADVGRDPSEIEVSVMFRNFAPDASADDVVAAAEAYREVGVDTLVVGATGDDPATWLEETFGPVIDRIHAL
jgi:alkanesulfonate monooxygenase SsuD/methylene tetrahydromethanopterin reductase-like flavin-dependent oxidoreductase (luciferase family)